ncbi:MAG TPA: hypothetical protein VIL46_02275 [Gemmataceae bacterium]
MTAEAEGPTPPPPAGNCFGGRDYVCAEAAAGTARSRFGGRVLALPLEFLRSLREVLARDHGPRADGALRAAGAYWGRGLAARIDAEVRASRGAPLTGAPLAEFAAHLGEALAAHGLGRLRLDLSRAARGVLAVELRDGIDAADPGDAPSDPLLEGMLAGLFSHLTGQELDCVQTDRQGRAGAERSRFVLGLLTRMGRPRQMQAEGAAFEEVIRELERE